MAVTLKEIADAAKVSRGTVDRVLHGRDGVNEETRKRVLEIIEQMHYNPNVMARALKTSNKTIKIGVIVRSENNAFFIDVIQGIQAAARSAASYGIEVICLKMESINPQRMIEQIDHLERMGVNGIAMIGVESMQVCNRINALPDSIPVITYNSDMTHTKRMCFVGNDHLVAGRTAGCLMHTALRKPGKIALLISQIEMKAHLERITGFKQIFDEDAHSEFDFIGPYMTYEMEEAAYDIVQELLNREKDLVGIYVAGGGQQSAGRALAQSSRAGEVHMVCHDLLPETIEYVQRGIVDFTIGQDAFEQGYMPIELFKDYYILGRKPSMEKLYTRIDIRTRENITFKGYEVFTSMYSTRRDSF